MFYGAAPDNSLFHTYNDGFEEVAQTAQYASGFKAFGWIPAVLGITDLLIIPTMVAGIFEELYTLKKIDDSRSTQSADGFSSLLFGFGTLSCVIPALYLVAEDPPEPAEEEEPHEKKNKQDNSEQD